MMIPTYLPKVIYYVVILAAFAFLLYIIIKVPQYRFWAIAAIVFFAFVKFRLWRCFPCEKKAVRKQLASEIEEATAEQLEQIKQLQKKYDAAKDDITKYKLLLAKAEQQQQQRSRETSGCDVDADDESITSKSNDSSDIKVRRTLPYNQNSTSRQALKHQLAATQGMTKKEGQVKQIASNLGQALRLKQHDQKKSKASAHKDIALPMGMAAGNAFLGHRRRNGLVPCPTRETDESLYEAYQQRQHTTEASPYRPSTSPYSTGQLHYEPNTRAHPHEPFALDLRAIQGHQRQYDMNGVLAQTMRNGQGTHQTVSQSPRGGGDLHFESPRSRSPAANHPTKSPSRSYQHLNQSMQQQQPFTHEMNPPQYHQRFGTPPRAAAAQLSPSRLPAGMVQSPSPDYKAERGRVLLQQAQDIQLSRFQPSPAASPRSQSPSVSVARPLFVAQQPHQQRQQQQPSAQTCSVNILSTPTRSRSRQQGYDEHTAIYVQPEPEAFNGPAQSISRSASVQSGWWG